MGRRRWIPAGLGVLGIGIAAGFATTCSTPGEAPKGPCPYRTAAEWQAFLEEFAARPEWAKTCEEGDCDQQFYSLVETKVLKVFEQCAPVFAQSPGIAACTENLRRFTPVWIRQHCPDSYGFNQENRGYFTSQEAPEIPQGTMVPPPLLVAAIPDLGRVTQVAREMGLRYLLQASCLGGSRVFVIISDPEGRFDQWLLINLEGTGAERRIDVHKTVSFLGIQKKDAAGHQLPHVRVFFRDYIIESTDAGGSALSLPDTAGTKCYACHPSGARELIVQRGSALEARPVRGETGIDESSPEQLRAFAARRLLEFNEKLRSYGVCDYTGQIPISDLGPALGTEEGCSGCHDGKYRGRLTLATSSLQIGEKVLAQLSMPPSPNLPLLVERSETHNPPLTTSEEADLRRAFEAHQKLYDHIEASRTRVLANWLLEVRCR